MGGAGATTFEVRGGRAPGYLARPGSGKAGVVVVQEWWGLVPHVEELVRRFAQAGYVALAPDLYHGKKTVEAEEAQHLMNQLDWSRAATEIAAAVVHLREHEGCARVGIVGFCMGGALAVIGASVAAVDSYVSFYGFPPEGSCNLAKVVSPGLLLFGEHEEFFDVLQAREFVAAQNARGVATELVVYPSAGHAFFNDHRPEVFEPAAAQDAWRRTTAFFDRVLRG